MSKANHMTTKEVKMTPLMQQYEKIKVDHQDKLLFFRMGDFYELFNEDAEIASRVLGITLTARGKSEDAAPLAGIPYHALDQYLPKVIKAGYRAAICEQVEDPALAKGIVKRAVTRIVTPGTVLEDNLLDGKSNNFILSVIENKNSLGVAIADISTGEFGVLETNLKEAINFIARVNPSEIIFSDQLNVQSTLVKHIRDINNGLFNFHADWSFSNDAATELLYDQFGVKTLEGFGITNEENAVSAAGGLLHYLRDTQKDSVKQISRIKKIQQSHILLIDRTTQKNLELVKPINPDGTCLIEVIDFTTTAMGGRLLKRWVLAPLIDIKTIEKRQEGVKELISHTNLLSQVQKELSKIADIERILARVCARRAGPRELIALKRSLVVLPNIKLMTNVFNSSYIVNLVNNFDQFSNVIDRITNTIKSDPPVNLADGGVICDGYNKDLDELRDISLHGKEYIASLQQRVSDELQIPKLKVGYNRVFGYYFEVSKLHAEKIPDSFIRKQTLANAERFISPELKEYETKVLSAQEKILKIEQTIYQELVEFVAQFVGSIQLLADDIAEFDVICSFSNHALRDNLVCPVLNQDLDIYIKEGRHPVIEHLLNAGSFVPNDLIMKYSENQIMLITGPNMAGKSTYIRQIAILVVLAQMGSFIPATSASIGIVDKIFTRVGASDDLSKGHSTFMVEMAETANILNNATNRSLVILDEVGRGTSTFDGVSLAWAITEYLHNVESVAARTVFATHYHELLEMEKLFERVSNYNVVVKEWKGDIIFQHKIVKGGSDKSYGIHVAKLAGLPKVVVDRAKNILKQLEKIDIDISGNRSLHVKKAAPDFQMTLFTEAESKLSDFVKEIDLNQLTPLDALIKLKELQKLAEEASY